MSKFKMYESNKSQNQSLQMSSAGVTTIIPGDLLVREATGLRKAVTGGASSDTVDATNLHNYFIATGSYDLATNGKIAAVPLIDFFTAEILTANFASALKTVSFDTPLTIIKGEWCTVASNPAVTSYVIARGTATNNTGGDEVTCISTFCERYTVAHT